MTRWLAADGCELPNVTNGMKRDRRCKHDFLYVSEKSLRSVGGDAESGMRPSREARGVPENRGIGAASNTPRRRKGLKQGRGFAASGEQQRSTHGRACIVCGRDGAETTVDAAHVTPRRLAPHCDCEKGTVPLCRDCHRRYDDLNDPFDLLPHLMAHGLYEETVHGFLEHGVSLREVMDTVTGQKWQPVREAERSAA